MWTIPDDFKLLCHTFHEGVDDVYSSTDEMIKDAVAKLNESQRAVVRAYLDELTSGKYNEEELWRLWYEAGARIRITTGIPGESARFLGMVKAEIDSLK